MRWFRWYRDTCEDGKFRIVARASRVTVRDVLAVWAFILEDASRSEHRGECRRMETDMCAILDFEDDGTVERILEHMIDAKLIAVGPDSITVNNWNTRQFESDTDNTAVDRQRRKRAKDREARDASVSHEDVTRDQNAQNTEDREQNKKKSIKKKGSRIEEDFSFSQETIDDAVSRGLTLDEIRDQLSRFRDYWAAKAGAGGVKLDWQGTARNWLRKAADDKKNTRKFTNGSSMPVGASAHFKSPQPTETRAEYIARITGRN